MRLMHSLLRSRCNPSSTITSCRRPPTSTSATSWTPSSPQVQTLLFIYMNRPLMRNARQHRRRHRQHLEGMGPFWWKHQVRRRSWRKWLFERSSLEWPFCCYSLDKVLPSCSRSTRTSTSTLPAWTRPSTSTGKHMRALWLGWLLTSDYTSYIRPGLGDSGDRLWNTAA